MAITANFQNFEISQNEYTMDGHSTRNTAEKKLTRQQDDSQISRSSKARRSIENL